MKKGEYQRYKIIVLGFFPLYQEYLFYRRPKKRKMLKVIRAFKGARM